MLPLATLVKKSIQLIQKEGLSTFHSRARDYLSRYISLKSYLNYQNLLKKKAKLHRNWYLQNGRPVSIIIPSYNDSHYLKKCLQSLKCTLPPHSADSMEILIVDDASTLQEHQDFLKNLSLPQTGIPIQVIQKQKNEGFASTVHLGLQQIGEKDCVILNSDIEAHAGWLEALQFAAYQKESIGIVGPKLLYPDGSIQSAGSHRNREAPEWFDHYYRHKPGFYGPTNFPREMLAMTGACLYVKSTVLKKIGLLDTNYPMAFEDMDFCLRARQAEFEILYTPFSILTHHESVSRGKQLGPREKESLTYFWKKWKPGFDERNVRTPDGKIKITFVLQTTEIAGGHRIIFEYANRLLELGFEIKVYATDQPPQWFPLEAHFKRFHSLNDLTETLKTEECIKVATWWKTAEPVWLASLQKGIPVYFVQDIETSYYKNDRLIQDTVLASYRKEFRYLTTSQWNSQELKKLDLQASIIPCGINLEVFKTTGEERKKNILITAGRKNPLKNLSFTLKGWSAMQRNQPTLWMYGSEPELAKNLKNCEYFFQPSDRKINSLLNQATVFILTSEHEGFALTILEAMAAGTPVICTDADGNRDFCTDGVNCLMIQKGNERMLVQTLERLFSDPQLQENLRQEGYQTAQQYGWDMVIQKAAEFMTKARIPDSPKI